jgi:transposase
MKSKDLQKVVLSKYQKGDTPKKIYHDLNGGVGLRTIERRCQMIRRSGAITLSKPPGGPRLARTKENIQKVKNRLRRKKMCQLEKYRWSLTYPKEVFGE